MCDTMVFTMVWFLLLLLSTDNVHGVDSCSHSYFPIPNMMKRSTNYTAGLGEPYIDDHLLSADWYGYEGFDIPEKPVTALSCGSKNVVYLIDTLPVEPIFKEQTFRACVATITKTCAITLNIEIEGCSKKLRIYKLTSTPLFQSAYCFDNPNIKGLSTPPTFVPTSVKVESTFYWEECKSTICIEPKLEFKCAFKPHTDKLFYQILWFVDGKMLQPRGRTTQPGNETLKQHEFSSRKLGFDVSCGVTAFQSLTGLPGNTTKSSTFFAGIRATQSRVRVERAAKMQLDLEFTIPFLCAHITKGNNPKIMRENSKCAIVLDMSYNKSTALTGGIASDELGNSSNLCGKIIVGMLKEDYESGKKWNRIYSWNITTVDDNHFGKDSSFFVLHLKTSSTVNPDLWHDYKLGNIQVEVYDKDNPWKNARCKAYADPHMTTFDGSIYEMEKEGNYTLYRHEVHPIEVQAKIKACGFGIDAAKCVFGVYVRSGADIFVVSPDDHFIGFLVCDDSSLDVYYMNEKTYEIILPTGAKVVVTMVQNSALNVDIFPAPRDQDNVTGLCGDLDGTKSNDFFIKGSDYGQKTRCGSNGHHLECRNRFIDYFHVPDKSVLFATDLPLNLKKHWKGSEMVCICAKDKDYSKEKKPDKTFAESVCSFKKHLNVKPDSNPMRCKVKKLRKKRDIADRFKYMDNHIQKVHNIVKKRTTEAYKRKKRATITGEQAKHHCEDKIFKSSAIDVCNKTVPNLKTTNELENCIYDVQVMGSTDWSLSAVESVKKGCFQQAEKNDTLRKSVVPNNFLTNVSSNGSITSFASLIKSVICPNDCSGNGNCNDGRCDCYQHYGGSDCSFDMTKPPIIHNVLGDDHCDTADEKCDEMNIHGENFVKSSNLSCKFWINSIDVNGNVSETNGPFYNEAEGLSIFEVVCPLTTRLHKRSLDSTKVFVQSYDISIANDGTLYGLNKTIFKFDSTCQSRTKQPHVFTLLDGFCFIYGTCIPNGDINPQNLHSKCDISQNRFFWTVLPTHKEDSGEKKRIIIGTTVGLTAALAIIIGLLFTINVLKKKHSRKATAPYPDFDSVPNQSVQTGKASRYQKQPQC